MNYDEIYADIYEQLENNKEILIEISLKAEGVTWQKDDIVLFSGEIMSLDKYSEELNSDISDSLSSLFKIMYNELSDSPDISYTVELKKNCLLEIIGLTVSLYREMSKMELVIVATLLSSFAAGFLGFGFYKTKKETEKIKYTANKEIEKVTLELEKEKIKLAQLQIKERILNSSQKAYDLADRHKKKLSEDLDTDNIVTSKIKINDCEYENTPDNDPEDEEQRMSM